MSQNNLNQKVSVIIPYYEGAASDLKKSIDSVINQTHKNIECIVVDDGSEIPFAELGRSFNDKRIRWIELKKNLGVADARNAGISASDGSFLAFLDTGDWWELDKIQRQVDTLNKTGCKWGYTACINYTPNRNRYISYSQAPSPIFPSILKKNFITGSASGVMVKRELINTIGGFDNRTDIVEDWDMWIRMATVEEPFYIPFPLVNIIAFDMKSRSKQVEQKLRRMDGTIEKYWEIIKCHNFENKVKAHRFFIEGHLHLLSNQPLKGLKAWSKILRIKPRFFPYKKGGVGFFSLFYPPLYYKITCLIEKLKK